MSARHQRRRFRRREEFDLFRNLGPGDPGYRLRPGASGLDPMDAYQEAGRVTGLLFKSLLDGRSGLLQIPSLAVLFVGLIWVSLWIFQTPASIFQLDAWWALLLPAVVLFGTSFISAGRRLSGRPAGTREGEL